MIYNDPSYDLVSEHFFYKDGGLFWKKSPQCSIKKGDRAGCESYQGYRYVRVKGKTYREHRVIFILVNGAIDSSLVVDHINGIRSDNRIENLRQLTTSENAMNCKIHRDGTKIPFVTFDKRSGSYKVADGKNYYGTFYSLEDAISASKEKKIVLKNNKNEFKYVYKSGSNYRVRAKVCGVKKDFGSFKLINDAIQMSLMVQFGEIHE